MDPAGAGAEREDRHCDRNAVGRLSQRRGDAVVARRQAGKELRGTMSEAVGRTRI
jgi:hypothetical protein